MKNMREVVIVSVKQELFYNAKQLCQSILLKLLIMKTNFNLVNRDKIKQLRIIYIDGFVKLCCQHNFFL